VYDSCYVNALPCFFCDLCVLCAFALQLGLIVTLADQIDDLLPQTQCTQCGYNGCRPYAQAIASGEAPINRCPPGGAQGINRLAALLGCEVLPLDPEYGAEKEPAAALIDEQWCIGCTLCIQACPVDAIVGAPKRMHTVLLERCTGCELCIAPCPVDCIEMIPVARLRERGATLSLAGPAPLESRGRYRLRQVRLQREQQETRVRLAEKARAKLRELQMQATTEEMQRKRAAIESALQRARARRGSR
jgi:electron transport complex protein RnfB